MKKISFKLLFAGLFFFLTSCQTVDDYMFGQDNSPVPSELSSFDSKLKLKEKWSVASGTIKSHDRFLKLKPAIAGNFVYTATPSGLIFAHNKEKGTLVWQKKLGTGIVSGPVVQNDVLFVGTDDASLLALNAKGGERLWKATLSADMLAKPRQSGSYVIAKTIDGNLYALNRTTGQQIWKYSHGAPELILKASASPVIVKNSVIVPFSDGKLDVVSLETGHLLWQRGIVYANGASEVERLVDIDADPLVENDRIFLAGFQGVVGAYALSDGHPIWEKQASVFHNMVLSSKALYIVDASDVIWGLNKQTGQVLWKQEKLKARSLTAPEISGSYLVLGDKTGYLHMLSLTTGAFVSRLALGASISTPPTTEGTGIYVMSANGKLSAFSVS